MTARNIVLDETQRRLLEESAEWRLTGLLFECPDAGWHEKIAALASEVTGSDLQDAAAAAPREATEGYYHSVFGPGGPASPREVSYRDLIQLGHLLSELTSYYEAFGYQPATQEPCDHVSVEAGFIAYLRLKEAYALACGDAEHAQVTSEAARRFIEDHLSAMAEPLAGALEGSGVHYLAAAGRALLRRAGPRKRALAIHPTCDQAVAEDGAFHCGK